MKVAPREADRFCQAPPKGIRAVLLYGPDGGLVRERAARLAATVAPPDDPFRIAELTAADLKDDPARLADEAAAIPFGGGRRVLRIRDAGDPLAKLFETFLEDLPPGDALIVIEAGDLSPRGLRKVFEGAEAGAALACYRDEGDSLRQVVTQHLSAAGLTVDPAALAYLVANLGGDRQLTRRELDKLALYVGPAGGGRVTLADAAAMVGDSAERTLDDLSSAVTGGDLPGLLRDLGRAVGEGTSPIAILRGVARSVQRLHLLRGFMAEGVPAAEAVKRLRPPVFWKEAGTLARQAESWPSDRLAWALGRLLEAEANCKRTGAPQALLCERALTEIAARAARRQAGRR